MVINWPKFISRLCLVAFCLFSIGWLFKSGVSFFISSDSTGVPLSSQTIISDNVRVIATPLINISDKELQFNIQIESTQNFNYLDYPFDSLSFLQFDESIVRHADEWVIRTKSSYLVDGVLTFRFSDQIPNQFNFIVYIDSPVTLSWSLDI